MQRCLGRAEQCIARLPVGSGFAIRLLKEMFFSLEILAENSCTSFQQALSLDITVATKPLPKDCFMAHRLDKVTTIMIGLEKAFISGKTTP